MRLDRYLFTQLMGPFAFFALLLVGIVWLGQSLRVVELVAGSGEAVGRILSLSLLLIPPVMVDVLPVAALAGTMLTLSRLTRESEMVVMKSAGQTPAALLRPIGAFGLVVALMVVILAGFLAPKARYDLADQRQEIGQDIAAAILQDGQFIEPVDGVTLFLTDSSSAGEIRGIFISDRRDAAQEVTYSATRALLTRNDQGTPLLMLFDGTVIRAGDAREIESGRFERFSMDLSGMIESEPVEMRPRYYALPALFAPDADMLTDRDAGEYRAEAHARLGLALLGFVFPLVAGASYTTGSYSRRGSRRPLIRALIVATLAYIAVKLISGQAEDNPALAPMIYAPALAALIWTAALVTLDRRSWRAI
ncbi:LptF/LptG family permease [Paracoccaceae bacterium GXU_MW_L88]